MLIRLFSYMKQYKKYAVLAMFCITAEGILELLVPLIMADLVDVGVAKGDTAYIYDKGSADGGLRGDCPGSGHRGAPGLRLWRDRGWERSSAGRSMRGFSTILFPILIISGPHHW